MAEISKRYDKDDPITREEVRRTFYKTRIRKDNIRLELDEDKSQEERRRLLLEFQKKHREEAFNAARNILQQEYYSELKDEEELNDEEELKDEEELMETEQSESKSKFASTYKHHKQPLMMLSEWMLEVPQDFINNWIMVPCPLGKRNRIVASKGVTKVYNRKGLLCNTFHSALPGGNPDSNRQHYTILDCIWVKSRKVYYVLDMLAWSVQPFMNCEAEFRLHWIDSKIKEIPEFKDSETETNTFPILPLPRIKCSSDLSEALTNLPSELFPLDGILFYHRYAHYNFGVTPLVMWLKPFMLSEILGMWVPSPLDEKPDDYVNFEHHVNSVMQKKKKQSKRIVENFMEIV